MTVSDYIVSIKQLDIEYIKNKNELLNKFVNDNAEFKIGDFIYNVTGIIKIEQIKGELVHGVPHIKYLGYKYHNSKGKLIKTKFYNKEYHSLSHYIKKHHIQHEL